MPPSVKIQFAPLDKLALAAPGASGAPSDSAKSAQTLVIFAGPDLKLGAATLKLIGAEAEALIRRGAATAKFKGKVSSALDLIAPAGIAADRLLVIGAPGEEAAEQKTPEAGKPEAAAPAKPAAPPTLSDYANLGGVVGGKLGRGAAATIVFDLPRAPEDAAAAAAEFALGLQLRDYRFDRYKTKKKDDADENGVSEIVVALADPEAAREKAAGREAVAAGVITARSLVNEPANILFPEEFAARAKELEKLGVEVEILDEPAMQALGMGALLGVGQGSSRQSRVVVMRWRGAGEGGDSKPIAFVGKGVTFDTGGISIKPAAGMEDMKGDMAGAACVVGLIEALAARKAKVDAIGAIGLVENMPGPDAQRPGDIVKSMSGQTIEIINTDAEGRLVLGDVLWYVQDRFKPKFMIDLATLTGAVLVALGQEHAGLFTNDDDLGEKLLAAGKATGEKLWRLPLAPAYDKMIDSKFADMKNTGGRHAGSITAAQFLQRFVNGTPWAHLDIAGTGMSSPSSDVNQSWGSGFGVRLLDRLVSDNYES
ncbi:Leucyl aminopeptidase [Methylocella silvestris BL2]|uniref:Probable cytosol aminopeptidase n=1 Tax=Methylocella silvestris (strain DSM 15510 / CIP 108128 / LMG 27833 / NCIMB 13906 / BL2) TaxID=395965 RepID=B8ET17_METSB|nr:leucyl aminopeptidase [Methylocella silvestris]ACK51155.1 Leucyl aminopeptidase [Methylocella silvestris BL2]